MMKTKAISLALAALMGVASASSFAQGYDRRDNDRHDQNYGQRNDRDHGRGDNDRRDGRRDNGRRDGRWDNNRQDRRADGYYYNARGPEWRRGGHIPPQYRSRQYVVNDWRGHHLHAPPRGYQWVQVGSDYVMVAIATGIIANLILSQ